MSAPEHNFPVQRDGSGLVGRVAGSLVASSSPSVSPVQHGTEPFRRTAEISRFPKIKHPPLPDYAKACAMLICATFPAPSHNAICDRAEAETGAASADTFSRIINGQTKKPDGYLMHCVLGHALVRGVAIPATLAIRIEAAE